MRRLISGVAGIATMSLIVGCGGGGGDTPSKITGHFRDATVVGLHFKSGANENETDATGSFSCIKGEKIKFSVGKVVLGEATCDELITPINLVANGTLETRKVINIVRFLVTLDEDGNPSNGIKIGEGTRRLAEKWVQPDLDALDLGSDAGIVKILLDLEDAIPSFSGLYGASDAKQHAEATLRCAYAGAFKGSFSGADSGPVGTLIDPADGHMEIIGYSTKAGEDGMDGSFSGSGTLGFSLDGDRKVSGSTSMGSVFNGEITDSNHISGTWKWESEKGSFSGARVGGSTNAQYRLVGHYIGSGGAKGLYSFDIDNNNKVTGIAYNPDDGEEHTIEGVEQSITGTVDGMHLNATTSGGMTIQAIYDKETGILTDGVWSGTWKGNSISGTFTASGCRLN